MKKILTNLIFASLLLLFILPDISLSQMPIRKKRSEELTKTAINLYKADQIEAAKDHLQRAVKLDEQNVLAHEMLSLVFYKEQKTIQAVEHANIAISLDKKAARAYYILGLISYQNGAKEQAKDELTQSLRYLDDPERRRNAMKILNKLKETFDGERIKKVSDKLRPLKDKPEIEPAEAGYSPYVAVFNLENTNPRTEEKELGATLTEMLVTALIKSEKFTIMERVQLEKILNEQSLSMSGAISSNQAIEVGKLAGLEAVILGSVSQLAASIEADARLIDVETGKAVAAANSKVTNIDRIRDLANELANQLGLKAGLIEPKYQSKDTTDIE